MNDEEILDIKRENYKLRKENFELIQDNVKINQEKDLLSYKFKKQICSSIPLAKIKEKIEDYTERKRYYDDNNYLRDLEYRRIEAKIEILQELLEGK